MKEKIFAYLNDNYSTVTRTMDIALHRSIGARTDSRRVSREDYEDFKGEGVLRMLKYAGSCDASRKPSTWGATIAVNASKDVLGARAEHPVSSLDVTYETEDGRCERVFDVDGGDCASCEAEHNSQVEQLMDYAQRCSPLQRRIAELTLQDYLPREIADELGISSKRVQEEKSRFIHGAKLFFAAERGVRIAA